MALIPSDLERLEKGAINFLYTFISPNAKGLSAEVMIRREAQIEELKKIYSYGVSYTWVDMMNIIRGGIVKRYGKHPEQLLQHMYNITVRRPSVGSPTPENSNVSLADDNERSAQNLINMTANVSEGGATKKKSFWEDAKSVIEWLVEIFQKLFGRYTDPNVYVPQSSNWTYYNRPIGEPETTKSSFGSGMFGYAAAAGIVFFALNNGKPKQKKKK